MEILQICGILLFDINLIREFKTIIPLILKKLEYVLIKL